jgi:hypothetical protein
MNKNLVKIQFWTCSIAVALNGLSHNIDKFCFLITCKKYITILSFLTFCL